MHVKNWDTRKIWSLVYFVGLFFIFLFHFYLSGTLDKRFWGINYFLPPKLFLISYPFWLILYSRSSWRLRLIDFFILPIFVGNWILGTFLFGNREVIGLLIDPGIISLLVLAYYFLMFMLKERYMGYFKPGIILFSFSIMYQIIHYFLMLYCIIPD